MLHPVMVKKKPIPLAAIKWTGTDENFRAIEKHTFALFRLIPPADRGDNPEMDAEVFDYLHSKWIPLAVGDWVMRGVKGEFYPCEGEVFDTTYEPA